MQLMRKHFLSIDSTNSWAKHNASLFSKEALTLVTADTQTAGRGRFNRRWISPEGQNIYATFAFFVEKQRRDLGNIPQLLALSAAKTLAQFGLNPEIKWPNDILLAQKKVAGILAETTPVSNELCMLVGIGLNVNMPQELLQEIDRPATSICVESGKAYEVEAVLQQLLQQFTPDLKKFLKEGFAPFLEAFRAFMVADPKTSVHFHDNQRIWQGTVHSINADGSLNLKLESGEIKTFIAGEIVI
jgi:BirA family transcriptional regulator, biotin operon repressor / biotin---[acetyl-CoA-carboxylase] ligase